jgi:hypothetical protein
MYNQHETSSDAPDAHFDQPSLLSGTKAQKVGNQGGKCENCKRGRKNSKHKLCHEIEPNLSKDRAMYGGDNPSF